MYKSILYYKHSIAPKCFGSSCGYHQGGALYNTYFSELGTLHVCTGSHTLVISSLTGVPK